MGRSRVSGLTLPRCQRLSSSTRCLTATWALAWKCCILQPPHKPKNSHCGVTRCELSRRRSVIVACSQLFLRRVTLTRTSSPGKASSMKTTLPSARWATPWASRSRDSTVSHSRCGGTGASSASAGAAETETGDDSLIPRLSQDSGPIRKPACIDLTRGQLLDRVNRLALLANFKVQLHPIRVGGAHFGDLLTLAHHLVFLDQQGLVVSVGRQVVAGVLDDDQVAVAAQTGAGIHHAAVTRSHHGITRLARDGDALALALFKLADDGAVGGPDPSRFVSVLAVLGIFG